jgi:DNA polymerase
MATKIYNIPAETITKDSRERFHGKQTILGCGYGMAWKKFQVTCAGYGLFITDDEAKKTITIFRKANAKIVHLWKMLHIKAVEAISKPNTYTSYKKISFMFTEGYLFMVLPNGKLLAYPKADVKREENPWGKMVWNIYHEGFDTYTKQWTSLLLTGTRLTENGTQAICREILLEACLDLIRAGYNPMLTVHDEAVSEDDDGFGSLEEMCAILCARSEYWEGFPLKAEGFTAIRYRK